VQALWAADFMGSHTTEALQCLILLGVFMVGHKLAGME
jgi:hypothetical protein